MPEHVAPELRLPVQPGSEGLDLLQPEQAPLQVAGLAQHTALFARAAGIIAESGGPLSHGAIAAREQGIPAVMAVWDAMARLVNGQMLRLDGSRGTVGLVA